VRPLVTGTEGHCADWHTNHPFSCRGVGGFGTAVSSHYSNGTKTHGPVSGFETGRLRTVPANPGVPGGRVGCGANCGPGLGSNPFSPG
jgi:hypothetical protein